MKYIKTLGELKIISEGINQRNTKFEEDILRSIGLTINSGIYLEDIYPLDKWVEKKTINGVDIIFRLNDNGSVDYKII